MAEKLQPVEILDSTEVYFIEPQRAAKRQQALERRLAAIGAYETIEVPTVSNNAEQE